MATATQSKNVPQKQKQQSASWFALLKQTASEWSDADAMTWAAALSCYTVLALAPLLVVAMRVAILMPGGRKAALEGIPKQAAQWMGNPQAADIAREMLSKIVNQSGGAIATIISSILVVVSVGGVIAEMQQALNRIWRVKPKAGAAMAAFIKARLKSIVVVVIAAVVLLASFAATTWVHDLVKNFGVLGRVLGQIVNVVASLGVITVLLGMVFRVVPDADIEWRSTWVGALISAILFVVGNYGLSLYFRFGTPTSAYGAAGSLAAVLIWIYYSSAILFFGAQFTYVYAMRRGHGVRASKHARPLSECNEDETATPSAETPGHKPDKPAPSRGGRPAPGSKGGGGYADVLAPHVSPAFRQSSTPAQPAGPVVSPTLLAAGAGLALGALVGGYGALKINEEQEPPLRKLPPKVQAAVRLRRRVERLEQKVKHASRVKQFLERDDLPDRLDQIEEKIRTTGQTRKHGRPVLLGRTYVWATRVKSLVKQFT